MTAPITNQPQFGNAAALGQLVQRLPFTQRALSGMVGVAEGSFSHGKAFQDVSASLGSRLPVSRSLAESIEIAFNEITGCLLVYFGVPLSAAHIFKRLFKPKTIDAALMSKPLTEKALKTMSPDTVKRLLPARAAVPIAAIGSMIILGEWALHYVKNLITEKKFHQNKFSDVVNLSEGNINPDKESFYAKKAKRRIKQCLAATAALVGGLALFSRFGHKLPGAKAISQFVVKHLDFKTVNGKAFQFSRNQLALYMLLYVGLAWDAARDTLEKKETLSRLGLILPYLLFIQDHVNIMFARLGFKDLLKPNTDKAVGLSKLLATPFKLKTQQDILKSTLPEADKLKLLKSRNLHYLLSLGVGVIGVGMATAALNRYWTKKRYERNQAQQQKFAAQQKQHAKKPLETPKRVRPVQKPIVPTPFTQAATYPQYTYSQPVYATAYNALPGYGYTSYNTVSPYYPTVYYNNHKAYNPYYPYPNTLYTPASLY